MAVSGLPQVTLCLLKQNSQVLLAMKKRGFGQGKWNGVGGKVKPEETLEQGAIREAQEEIGIIPISLRKVAVLNFYFPKPDESWNQQVHVYMVNKWSGDPQESEEMKPQWFKITDIPYKSMWSADQEWMPKVLAGKKIVANIWFDKDQKLEKFEVVKESL